MRRRAVEFLLAYLILVCSCTNSGTQTVELKRFPVDDMGGVITVTGVEVDKEVSSDGEGSLRIEASEPTVVRLFEISDVEVEGHASFTWRK